LKVALNC